ncbi:glycosyltransferase family 2 protein [Sphaerisporangium dianthi]|uniref:Glycosyltransferase family 2 protein n=1 Tax=Sphaerisporangium dianthi TaxID=1436120 RepID=A0ABV9CMJ1_9ACTN
MPCLNEGRQVEVAYRELTEALAEIDDLEILFVDDGSTDDSLARIRGLARMDPRVNYLSFTRNFGLAAVEVAGFRYAAKEWTVQCDADLQVAPTEIRRLLDKAAEGYDVVFGMRQGRKDPLVRKLGSFMLHWLAGRVFGIDFPPGSSNFRVARSSVARTVVDLGLSWFIPAVPLVGARYALTPVSHRARTEGRSRLGLGKLTAYSLELFFGFSWRPLSAVYAMAAAGALLAAVLAIAGVAGAAGPALLGAGGVLLSGLTLGSVGLVARYLRRLMREAGGLRPYYIREASVPVRAADTLDGGPSWAPDQRERQAEPSAVTG